jgi:fluoride ion exporter CrcB/FEX
MLLLRHSTIVGVCDGAWLISWGALITNVVPGIVIGFLHAYRVGSDETRRLVSCVLMNIPAGLWAGAVGALFRSMVSHTEVKWFYGFVFGVFVLSLCLESRVEHGLRCRFI